MSRRCLCNLLAIAALVLTLLPGAALASYISNIQFDKESPCYLDNDTYVNISFDYKIDEPGGGRIWARPYTLGEPTPNYTASGSPLHPQGTGSATQYFRIVVGEAVVTHVRLYMTNADETETLLEIFLPVNFRYSNYGVYNVQTNHNEHDRLKLDEDLVIDFDYGTDEIGNVRIFARPFTDGVLTPGYSAGGSASLPPDGSYQQHFHFLSAADITDIRFQIWNDDQSVLLATFFYPFEASWREQGVYDVAFDWPQNESLHNTQYLTATFTIDHDVPNGVRVWAWCMTDGVYTPGGAYQGSILEPTGAHTVTRHCRVSDGEQFVDAIHFRLRDSDDVLLHEFDVPVKYHWAPHAVQAPVFSPPAPAILSNGEHLEMDFDYVTDDGGGVRIFARPAYDFEPLFGISSAGSPNYPAPSGTGDYWLTFESGEHLASQMRFQMYNDDQSVLHLEHFFTGWWAWGTSTTITGVDEVPAVGATALGRCYPNPFNPATTIPVSLARDGHVRLAVYDLRGRLVRTLQDGALVAGDHTFTFRGDHLASGAYICRLETPDGAQTQRLTLIK